MVLDTTDPILRRATDKPDNAGVGTWTLFAALAAVTVTLLAATHEPTLQTASVKPAIAVPAVTLVQ